MHFFTQAFLLALTLGLAAQLWLLQRQRRHVMAHRQQVPPSFIGAVSLQEHQKAADYTQARTGLGRIELVLGAGLLLVWTLGGGLQLLDTLWQGTGLDPLLRGTGLMVSLFLIMGLLDLPLSAWRTFVLEARFGFNRTTPRRFFLDLFLGGLVALILGTPLAWTVLWLMQQAGPFWWFATWAVWMGFTLFITWAYPSFIAPLFNRFEPLEDDSLRERIQHLLERCGFSSKGIYVMDGSKRSSHGNAYFTGLGRSKRIVFFDTLLQSLSPEEIEAVLAHELGHFKHRHVIKRMAVMALSSLGGLALLGWLYHQPWFYHALGVSQPSDAAALLLFLLVLPVFAQFFQPISSHLMRRHEFEADDYATIQADGRALIRALVKLYRENASTLTPDPLYSAYHDSHPPAAMRIDHISTKIALKATGDKPLTNPPPSSS
jgi:STE24 endopeptidase